MHADARNDPVRLANRARFARLVAQPDPALELARAALLIAADEHPDLEPEVTLAALDGLAERVRIVLDLGDDERIVLERIHDVLYRGAGFRAPTAVEFHDPRCSLLDAVIERRIGLPISLAVVELEVAWRLGLGLWGIGLPGHFIVGGPSGLLVDPADGGRRLTPDDCQAILRRAVGGHVLLHAGMLRPAPRRDIVARILRNLRAAHLARRDWPAALGVIDLLAIVEPTQPEHLRDRGVVLGRLGAFSEALAELDRYLATRPDATDAAEVREAMGIFRGRRN